MFDEPAAVCISALPTRPSERGRCICRRFCYSTTDRYFISTAMIIIAAAAAITAACFLRSDTIVAMNSRTKALIRKYLFVGAPMPSIRRPSDSAVRPARNTW